MRGFTAVEILIVLAIFGLLLASSMLALGQLRADSDVQADARGLQRTLELARNRTLASEEAASYGVYATSTNPHRYVLFQGSDYASRVVSQDEVHQLRDTIEFGAISFAGGQEVVFDRIQGTTSQAGSVELRLKAEPTNGRTVYVESSGAVEIDTSVAPTDDNRLKDSRHVHVDYSDMINVTPGDPAEESLIVDFVDSSPHITRTILMSANLSGGEFVWEEEIEVDGQMQKLKVHTHRLNNPDTQFSIHRAGPPIHTEPLTLELSGDVGTLIAYDAAGNVTQGTSAYASPPELQ